MELHRPSSREAPRVAELPSLPPIPPVIDALPIPAADPDSDSECPPIPSFRPRPRPSARQQRNQSATLMEFLSRRMSRQTLLQQQNLSRNAQLREEQQHQTTQQQQQQSQPPHQPPLQSSPQDGTLERTLEPHVHGRGYRTMELDQDEAFDDTYPSYPAPYSTARPRRTSQRHLSHPAPTPPQRKIDPSVASRVLQKLQASEALPSPDPATPSSPATRPEASPTIEVDPACRAGSDMEVDEGYGEAADDYAWLEDQHASGSGLSGAMRIHGVLRFTTSTEAALRCPKLVRNIPRMRRRNQKKKEHRLRAATVNSSGNGNGNGNGESSEAPMITMITAGPYRNEREIDQ